MIAVVAAVTLRSLLLEMASPDANTYLDEVGWTGRQWSSYDRRSVPGSAPDGKGWYANHDYSHFLRVWNHDGRTEWAMVDATGPGVLTRLWCANCRDAKIRFYLDGSETPLFEGVATNLIGSGVLAPRPFAQEDSPLQEAAYRSQNLYLPIPYEKGLVVTCELDPKDGRFWYNAETRTYPKGAAVKTFSKDQIADLPKSFDAAVEFKPLQREYRGPAAIRGLKIPAGRKVRISFDGVPSVDCSSDQLCGAGWTYVMPFRKSCVVELDDYDGCTAAVGDYRWDEERSMHFHARGLEWRNLRSWQGENRYYELNWLDVRGCGRLVGNALLVDNAIAEGDPVSWWGEGDEKIFVDGEPFPSYFGTGTEDFFGYSYGPGMPYTDHPFTALPRADNMLKGEGAQRTTAAFRRRRLDSIPFRKSLKLDVEVWHWVDCRMNYAPATFWYQLPRTEKNS